MKLYFRRQGEGPPLLLCHGLFGSGDNLLPLARLLEPDFDVICVDLRNHGRSPHDPSMTYAAMADDLVELLEDLHLPNAAVLGHSLGGKVALRLALDHPRRVASLLSADIGPQAYGPLHPEVFAALEALDLESVPSRSEADRLLSSGVPDSSTRGLLLKNLGKKEDGKFFWKMNLKALSMAKKDLGLALESANPFDGPACFVRGGGSDYIKDSDIPPIKKLFPAMELITLPNAGHWVHVDQPFEFVGAARSFFKADAPQ